LATCLNMRKRRHAGPREFHYIAGNGPCRAFSSRSSALQFSIQSS
jgi:hypothetical protein